MILGESLEYRTMTGKKARPKDISEYIEAAPNPARKKLREMRGCIRKAAPDATEGLKWGMPAFSYNRILVTFAAHTHHIGFYPTPSAEGVREGVGEIQYGERIDSVSVGEALAATLDSQNHHVSRARERRTRP